MKISNIIFLDINSDFTTLDLISGNDDIKKFLNSFGSMEKDKIIDLLGFTYIIENIRIELMDEEFLNIDLYLEKIIIKD
jgi:hypothetical protein